MIYSAGIWSEGSLIGDHVLNLVVSDANFGWLASKLLQYTTTEKENVPSKYLNAYLIFFFFNLKLVKENPRIWGQCINCHSCITGAQQRENKTQLSKSILLPINTEYALSHIVESFMFLSAQTQF